LRKRREEKRREEKRREEKRSEEKRRESINRTGAVVILLVTVAIVIQLI
jgi:membrane protein YqaA with SNARE-associated domain